MGNTGKRGEKKEPEDVRARKRVEEVVPRHIEQWAAAAGVRPTDQFQEDVTEALHAFMRARRLGPAAGVGAPCERHSRIWLTITVLYRSYWAIGRAAATCRPNSSSIRNLKVRNLRTYHS